MSKPIQLTIANIRAAATDAGNRYMRDHPNEKPEGTAKWTKEAFFASNTVFHRLCRAAGISPYQLPK